jgi:hypothetical protein
MASDPKKIRQYTLNELREILSDEIGKIREGGTTASNVNAISNATGKILSTIKLELEAVKLLGRTPVNLKAIAGLIEGDVAEEKRPAA